MSNIYKTHTPKSEGSGLYLKLEDNETVKIRIVSEPAIYETEYKDKATGEVRISTRYAWIVWNQETKTPQIMQQSATFFRSIANLAQDDEYGDPVGYDIKITRNGTGTDTTYAVVPSANRDILDDGAKEAIESIDLIEKLKASPYSQNINWLSDFDPTPKPVAPKPVAQPTRSILGKTTPAKEKKDDVVIEDIGDEPVNLDDIPF